MSQEAQSPPEYWSDIFPFEPYKNQIQGVNKAISTLKRDGVWLLEGPCGTGKTLTSLTASLALVRDKSTKFDRILVVTSKKQQLAAFENDLRTINTKTDSYFNGLSLVGKAELCPYVQAGVIDKEDIYHKCISLRDNTHKVMLEAVKAKKYEREANAAFGLKGYAETNKNRLSVRDQTTPYQSEIPSANGKEYCPFYANHITNSVTEEYPLSPTNVTKGKETLKQGSRAGTCPHLEMRRLHDYATILFGNYQHVFDPSTVASLTGPLLNEKTILICDEAHSLIEQVRDQLSYQLTYSTTRRAIADINQVQRWILGKGHDQSKCKLARAIFAKTGLTEADFGSAATFLEKLLDQISDEITRQLQEKYGNRWQDICRAEDRDEITIPLHDPADNSADIITKWVRKNEYKDLWLVFLKVAKLTSVIKETVAQRIDGESEFGTTPIAQASDLFERWGLGKTTEYYREITLKPRNSISHDPPQKRPWRAGYYATIHNRNCIPQNEIAATINAFGGAIIMSATLSPLDIYEEVTGIAKLRNGTQPKDSIVTKTRDRAEDNSEEDEKAEPDINSFGASDLEPLHHRDDNSDNESEQRFVKKTTFDLRFPTENRLSLAVDAPKFTYKNRGDPETKNDIRKQYARILSVGVTKTPGNVLICMPSYKEAEWAANSLKSNSMVNKEVLVDKSSSASETEQLIQSFITGDSKVLTTSLRGTLIEGVDYDGDKLKGVIICGVPIAQTSTNIAQAIETAYDERFNNNGFTYAFTIPSIHKTRQAIGRVIRNSTDVGVRILVDERYVTTDSYTSAIKHFPENAADEFIPISPTDLQQMLTQFWHKHDHR